MTYESTIRFTLDTICPWTYIGLSRLLTALSSLPTNDKIHFTLLFSSFLLNPSLPSGSASGAGEDKYTWYKTVKYQNSDDLMTKYTTVMTHLGEQESPPIPFDFTGTIAGTLHAHRCLHVYQAKYGPELTLKFVLALYQLYFTQRAHPSSQETLLKASLEAGVPEEEARKVVLDESVGLEEAERIVAEERGNGVDSVPVVVVEGRKRDFTLTGAKSVEEYKRCLETVAKEST